jgi:hypothetical protein
LKFRKSSALCALAIVLVAGVFAGCASTERVLFARQTNSVPVVSTNGFGLLVTNQVPQVTVDVAPAIKALLETAQKVNSAVNVTPTAAPVGWALGGVSGVLSIAAGFLTRKANRAQSAADANAQLLQTVIAGVEASNLPAVKETIDKLAKVLGTQTALAAVVQKQTA